MSARKRARHGVAGWLAVVLLASAAGPAAASCQEPYCHYKYGLGERQREAELWQVVQRHPDDAEALRHLDQILQSKVARERAIAEYEMKMTWRWRSLGDLESRVAAQRLAVARAQARLQPDDPSSWCHLSYILPDPLQRLELLRERRGITPDEPRLATCLAAELRRQELTADAIAVLRDFLDTHEPDSGVVHMLVSLYGEDEVAVQALLEEQARRRPDHLRSQVELLNRDLRADASEDSIQRGLAHVRTLLARPLSVSAMTELCRSLDWGRLHPQAAEATRSCWWELYRRPWPDADGEEVAAARVDAVEALIRDAYRDRDWPRAEPLLDLLPADRMAMVWLEIVDFTHGEFCPQFLDAYERSIPWQRDWHAERLASALQRCGQEALRRELQEAAGLLDDRGRVRSLVVTAERLTWLSPGFDGARLPKWSYLQRIADGAEPELQAQLERHAAENQADHMPWIYLAALHESRARAAAEQGRDSARREAERRAVECWREAAERRPGDLDLRVALGAAALRLHRPQTARAAALTILHGEANPRQAAEASYLLGRLARREGRWREASVRLVSYFLLRLRYAGYGSLETWERPLFLHLVEAGDRDQLQRYLEERATALAAYQAHRVQPLPGTHPVLIRRLFTPPELRGPDPALLALECVSPRALARLERRAAQRVDDPSLRRELQAARDRQVCTDEQLPDPEPLFPDDGLLYLSWHLRGAD